MAELLRLGGRVSPAALEREFGTAVPRLPDLARDLIRAHGLAVEVEGVDLVLAASGARPGRAPSGRGADGTPGAASTLVGRARENALLAERWTQAAGGRGQVVLLVGEAGIGKSRLVRALEAHIAGQPHLRLKAAGSAFYQNTAFHPIADLVRQALPVDPSRSDAVRIRHLRSALSGLGIADPEAAALLAPLTGIPPGAEPRPARTPERERLDMLKAAEQLFVRLGAAQPLLLVVEDLHWVDASSLELLDRLVRAVTAAGVLVVLTARPEFEPRWSDPLGVGVLTVGRLGRAQVERLVFAIAGGRPVPSATLSQIVGRSGGVPLFVEELTKVMLEAGGVPEERPRPAGAPLPASIQDSLVARLNRLPSGAETAQLAAVIGREFTVAMLLRVAPVGEAELRRDLGVLVDAELLSRSDGQAGEAYAFRHALVQEAAYRMLPRAARADVHGRVAAALEAEDGAAPELLAFHYAEAGLSVDAIRYWRKAGAEASGRIAYVEAIGHFGAALRLLQDLPDSRDRRRQELALRTAVGVPLVAARGYAAPEVEDCYGRAYDLSLELDDGERRFATVRGLWNLRLARAELDRARALGDQLLELAGNDAGRRVAAHRAMGVTLFSRGEFAAAAGHFHKAIEAYDPGLHAALAPEHGADPCVVCMSYLGTATWALGYPDQALRHVGDGLALARRLGHDLSIAVALTTAARFHQVRGEPRRVREHAAAVIALSEELGLPYWRALGGTLLGWAMAREGNPRGGIVAIQRGRKALRDTGAGLVEPWNLASLADAHRCAGEFGPALALLAESVVVSTATGERWWEAEQHRLAALCVLERGGPGAEADAEAGFGRAIALAREQGAKSLELRAATGLARLLRRSGRGDAARAGLAGIFDGFTEGFETDDLRVARATLDTPD